MPVMKELNRPYSTIGTELRPDGLKFMPWSSGRCLMWDITIIDSLISTTTPLFSESRILMKLLSILCDESECQKSEMTAHKHELLMFQHLFIYLF